MTNYEKFFTFGTINTSGLLKTSAPIDGTLRNVLDYSNTASLLSLSTTQVDVQTKLGIQSGAIYFETLSAPGACTATLAGIAGNIDNGTHSYKITFVNTIGETNLGTVSNVITIADKTVNGQINLTAIPISSDVTVVSRKIYRTKAGGSTYFPLVTISDNTTTIYTDNIADATMGTVTYTSSNSTSGSIFINAVPILSLFGNSNTFFGISAGNFTTFGSGFNSGFGNTVLTNNTTGTQNAGFGSFTLNANTTGFRNTAVGVLALTANTTGTQNTAVGNGALGHTVIANSATAVGYNALLGYVGDGDSTHSCTAVGATALQRLTTGIRNVSVGDGADTFNVTGSWNTFQGQLAGFGILNNSHDGNTGMGFQSLVAITTGGYNAAYGYNSGLANTTGSNNIFVGALTGGNTTGSNNILIGYNMNTQSVSASNTLAIGNLIFGTAIDGTGTTLSSGNIGIAIIAPTARLMLPAGTATASTAPLKFTSGTNLTTAEAGTMEYDGSLLYFTPSGTTRKTVAYSEALSTNILSTTTGIDGKIATTTTLYTVPTGKTAIITNAIIRVTTASTITVVPTLGIGRNATQDDIFASTTLTGLTATTVIYEFSGVGIIATGASTELIKLGIDVGATATTMTISIDLIGYLL